MIPITDVVRLLKIHEDLIAKVEGISGGPPPLARVQCMLLGRQAHRKLKRWYKDTGFHEPRLSTQKRYT